MVFPDNTEVEAIDGSRANPDLGSRDPFDLATTHPRAHSARSPSSLTDHPPQLPCTTNPRDPRPRSGGSQPRVHHRQTSTRRPSISLRYPLTLLTVPIDPVEFRSGTLMAERAMTLVRQVTARRWGRTPPFSYR